MLEEGLRGGCSSRIFLLPAAVFPKTGKIVILRRWQVSFLSCSGHWLHVVCKTLHILNKVLLLSCPLGSGSPDPTIRERSGEEAESAPGAFASPAWGSAPLCYGPILGFLCDSGPMVPARYRVTDRKPFRLCFLNPAGDSQAFTLSSVHTTCYCWTTCQSSLSLCV